MKQPIPSLSILAVLACVCMGMPFGCRATEATDVWEVFGSFGKARGQTRATATGFRFDGPGYALETTVETDGDISLRKTVLKNVSDKSITASCLMDRFPLEEGDWEVYTQSSYWENESRGRWQDLNTAVEVRNPNLRSGNGVAPMLAVHNRQTGRGRVFHLLTDAAYELHAVRSNPGSNRTTVSVEVGMDSRQLAYMLKSGETVALPEVLSYEFRNRTDLDCHKLHAWWNRHYPNRRPPAIYNTWLCRFDKLDADFLLKQVEKARGLGMEYFVIDAGWFGPARDWSSVRGEWAERPDGYLKGRMGEISAAVRKAGLKFGFWVEAESVMGGSKVAKEHPEWLLKDNRAFLDFENPEAFNYIVETVCALLKKYEASYLKFDFNQNLDHDATGRAFAAYNAAYRRFVREIRRRNPGIYIEGCASGGYMMDLGWARDFDGFWLSDNQSPRHGLRIAKETMLRLPPQKIERWIVARTAENLQPDYRGRDARLLATEDATWTHVLSYSPEFIDAFAAGGPYCFSCDLTAFSADHFNHFRDVVARRRAEGDFWKNAVGRILCDT
ncbi:MAG: alpha-galactosidase, partial [bacterium]|nr:alpha-galactosidase [bacterium]